MNETELERLVVRLTGDGEEYMRMLKQAQNETRETAQIVEQQGKVIESFGNKLTGFASGALSFLGSLGIRNWLNEAQAAYQEQYRADNRLRAMLEINGREVDKQFKRYQEFAAEMMNVAAAADETTIAMLQQAESMGVTGAAAERAVRNVIAAQASGIHIGIRQAVLLEQGVLGRLGRQLGNLGSGSEQEKIAKAQEKLTKMFGLAELQGKSAFKQLGIAWGELMEDFGKSFNELMKPIVEVKTAIINWFRSLSEGSKQAIVVLGAVAAGILAITAAVTTLGFIFNTMFGGVGLIVGVIVTAGAASAYWLAQFESIQNAWVYIKEVGGAAWDWIKGKALAFWGWLRPIAEQTWNVLVAGWELIQYAAGVAWDFIKFVAREVYYTLSADWRRFFSDFSVDWDNVARTIARVLIRIEFMLRNFGAVAQFIFDSLRLKMVQFVEETRHSVMSIFSDVGPREMTQFERELQASVDRQRTILARGLFALEDQRMAQLFGPRTSGEEAAIVEQGRRDEELRNNGKKKEMEKFESAARASAEAITRIYAYMDRVRDPIRSTTTARPWQEQTGTANSNYVASQSEVVTRQDRTNQLLTQVHQELQLIRRNPPVQVEDADIGD